MKRRGRDIRDKGRKQRLPPPVVANTRSLVADYQSSALSLSRQRRSEPDDPTVLEPPQDEWVWKLPLQVSGTKEPQVLLAVLCTDEKLKAFSESAATCKYLLGIYATSDVQMHYSYGEDKLDEVRSIRQILMRSKGRLGELAPSLNFVIAECQGLKAVGLGWNKRQLARAAQLALALMTAIAKDTPLVSKNGRLWRLRRAVDRCPTLLRGSRSPESSKRPLWPVADPAAQKRPRLGKDSSQCSRNPSAVKKPLPKAMPRSSAEIQPKAMPKTKAMPKPKKLPDQEKAAAVPLKAMPKQNHRQEQAAAATLKQAKAEPTSSESEDDEVGAAKPSHAAACVEEPETQRQRLKALLEPPLKQEADFGASCSESEENEFREEASGEEVDEVFNEEEPDEELQPSAEVRKPVGGDQQPSDGDKVELTGFQTSGLWLHRDTGLEEVLDMAKYRFTACVQPVKEELEEELDSPATASSSSWRSPLQLRIMEQVLKDSWRFDPSRTPQAWIDQRHLAKMVNVLSLHMTHEFISLTFRHGQHRGQPVRSLTEQLLDGTASLRDVPALLAVAMKGRYYVVFGNRRLHAIKKYQRRLPAAREVLVNTVVYDMDVMQLPDVIMARFLHGASSKSSGGIGMR